MTTDGVAVLRERAAGLPVFATANLPDTIEMLTVQVTRPVMEDMHIALARASRFLGAGLVGSGLADRFLFLMLATDSTFTRTRRLAVLFARRSGLWGDCDQDGVVLPAGPRSEVEFDYPDSALSAFGGVVELSAGALPAALEITRTRNAVCLASDPGVDPAPMFFGGSLALVDGRPPRLFTKGVRLVADGVCAMAFHGFGAFDDREVGVDVFAHVELLDGLEAAVRDEIAS